MSISGNWNFLLERVKKTEQENRSLIEECEKALQNMESVHHLTAKKYKEIEMPVLESIVHGYYRRNYYYLYSSFILGNMGFINPSQNLQRTVYETILLGYYFIVNPKEAKQYYEVLGTKDEEKYLTRKERYGHSYIRKRIFKETTQESHKQLYRELCYRSHPNLKGIFLDFPNYKAEEIQVVLNNILGFAYGNIQMITELFFDLLSYSEKDLIKTALKNIAVFKKFVPLYEPDSEKYASLLRFKKGNFENNL